MATINVSLNDGLKIGEKIFKNAVIREVTAGDLIDAHEAAEKCIKTPEGTWELVCNPTIVGMQVLAMQTVSIDDHPGPLTLEELKKLSAIDLSLLQEAAEALELATLAKLADRAKENGRSPTENRGRADADSE